jgi:hypothetical protein
MGLMREKGPKAGEKTKWEPGRRGQKRNCQRPKPGKRRQQGNKKGSWRVETTCQIMRLTGPGEEPTSGLHSGVVLRPGGLPDEARHGGEVVEQIGEEDQCGHPGETIDG